MAKKEVADLSVEEKLKTLYQLQTTLSGIDEKKALRGELPLEVQDLEDELEGLNIRVDKIKHDIADAEAAIQGNQQLIQEAQKSVERYQHQLDEVKNNREYDTLTKEIEYQSLEIELANKKIREAAMAIEERQRDLEIAQKTISERQIDLDEKRDELDEIMQETREEEEKLKAHAKELELKIKSSAAKGVEYSAITPSPPLTPSTICCCPKNCICANPNFSAILKFTPPHALSMLVCIA